MKLVFGKHCRAIVSALLLCGFAIASSSLASGKMPVFKEGPAAVYEGSYTVPATAIQGGAAYHRLLVYRPNPAECSENCPVVIVIHGGGFVAGGKEEKDSFSRKLSRQGFGVVNIDYRLAPPPGRDYKKRGSFPYPAAIEDAYAVVAWIKDKANLLSLKKNFGVSLDPRKIGVVGFSAGGTLAAHLALGRHVQAAIVTSGVSDFVEDARRPHKYSTWIADWFRSPHGQAETALQKRKKYHDASPARDLKRMAGAPPILIVHGQRDPKVLPSQARLLLHNLRRANPGARHKYQGFFYNGNHNNLGGYRRVGFTYRAMFRFLKANLGQRATR
jgi:acetyl esterase/lipase